MTPIRARVGAVRHLLRRGAGRLRLAALATPLILAACGGDVSRVEPFAPKRLVVLGDENSLITSTGATYTIRSTSCGGNPIWVQGVATHFGLSFAECPNGATAANSALMRATVDATIADLDAQVATLGGGDFADTDLFTLWVGQHDAQAIWQGSDTTANKLAAARAAGVKLATKVDALAGRNARILLVTVPDLSVAPLGVKASEAARKELAQIIEAFNVGLRVSIQSDGSHVGLVLADSLVTRMATYPSSYSLSNVTEAACTTALPNCTTTTLAPNASSTAWLWADDTHASPTVQGRIASLAISRATTNPF